MIRVFYDGKCGLCRREIAHYKSIAPKGQFTWCDLTEDASPFTTQGYALADGLSQLHVQDPEGHMHVGVGAFLVIWRRLPRWRWLGKFVGLPGIRQVAQGFYVLFARWRFSRLSHCQAALKTPSQS